MGSNRNNEDIVTYFPNRYNLEYVLCRQSRLQSEFIVFVEDEFVNLSMYYLCTSSDIYLKFAQIYYLIIKQ